jgi:hypothetical protein
LAITIYILPTKSCEYRQSAVSALLPRVSLRRSRNAAYNEGSRKLLVVICVFIAQMGTSCLTVLSFRNQYSADRKTYTDSVKNYFRYKDKT